MNAYGGKPDTVQPEIARSKPRSTVVAQRRDELHRAALKKARGALAPVDSQALAASGLDADQVRERVHAGLDNDTPHESSRSIWAIVRANVFTLFNLVLGSALVLVLLVGDPRDALFGFIVVANAAIGVVQEYRAKRTLDKLAVLHAPGALVLREGKEAEITVAQVLYDDVLLLRTGDQIPADAQVLSADSLEVDESLITGESDPVVKAPGANVLSGSSVVAGHGSARVSGVGADSYASALTAEARRFSLVNSEIRNSINKIIVYIAWALIPIIALVINGQMSAHGGWAASIASGQWRVAVVSAVASIVAMIPEGLVLLTSISFGVAAVSLARRNVLVQELPAVEGLARVDMVCLDKTGTLTEGRMQLSDVREFGPVHGWEQVLGWFAAHPNANATAAAMGVRFVPAPELTPSLSIPFSSARKFSAVEFPAGDSEGVWVLGAPEVVLNAHDAAAARVLDASSQAAGLGLRALVLAQRPSSDVSVEVTPENFSLDALRPVALLVFKEKVREDAGETLEYFRQQGVALKIISGDNPRTAAAVARDVGFDFQGDGLDARTLPEDLNELAFVLENQHVLGRVTPEQKKSIVLALQSRGHVVAMTGDGVNDALALKHADIGIAMGSGAAATKAVSRLVLLDGQFSHLPSVVAEGRRVIANVERVANLFLTKTAYAIIISIVIGLLMWRYPFLPRQLSIVSSMTIGIPAFFLALLPNARRYQPGFLKRALMFSVPAGLILSACIMGIYSYARANPNPGLSEAETITMAQTATTTTVLLVALWVLGALARPFDRWRTLLVAALVASLALIMAIPFTRKFFALDIPTGPLLGATIAVTVVGCIAVEFLYRFLKKRGAVSERE